MTQKDDGATMTPAEDLARYLTIHGFDEDTVQNAVLSLLSTATVVRHPRTWGWKAAVHYQQNQAIRDRAARLPELSLAVAQPHPNPSKWAEARQELAVAMATPPKRKPGRPRDGGPLAWQEDYQALRREQS